MYNGFLAPPINMYNDHKKMITQIILFVFLLIQSTLAQNHDHRAPPWLTLNGETPVVVARGGLSGLFPESSDIAYKFAVDTGPSDVILHCNIQLTKDAVGVCLSGLTIDNSTTIKDVYPTGQKTYNVDGHELSGWFVSDFTSDELITNVSLIQSIASRPYLFDGGVIQAFEDVVAAINQQTPPAFWLSFQHTDFYAQNKLDPVLYVTSILQVTRVNYISSPEIAFLKTLQTKVDKLHTNLIFEIGEPDAVEPTTKQSYASLLKDLSAIKLFASGILVPKEYIWPVDAQLYLKPHTTLVADAHKQGLKVYASGFANDKPSSYNYSYDPSAEYLNFIDNSQFAVDGFLTDFTPTAAEAIACLSNNKNATKPVQGKPLIITHNGASGVYPGGTDLAYQQAVADGADIIDCRVQMSKDGVAFCLDSPDLSTDTTALTTFMSASAKIPEIQKDSGIFSFDLTWTEIQTLKPQLKSPLVKEGILRNPVNKNTGRLMTLVDFLDFAKQKQVSGILIAIENAAYLASKKGFSVTDVVANALSNATFDKQSTQHVLIQSDDSSVLSKFSTFPSYKRVLTIKGQISDVPPQTVEEIKKFADAVDVHKTSIVPTSNFFTKSSTAIVEELHKANISVYVSVLKNEYMTIAFDYFSDPMVELATYLKLGADAFVTDFPATASAYLRSPCSDLSLQLPYMIIPTKPGSIISILPPEALPPSEAPARSLDVASVVDPPLPPVIAAASASTTPPSPPPSAQARNVANVSLCLVATVMLSLISMGF